MGSCLDPRFILCVALPSQPQAKDKTLSCRGKHLKTPTNNNVPRFQGGEGGKSRGETGKINDPDVIRTRSLLIWSQTRYRCATRSCWAVAIRALELGRRARRQCRPSAGGAGRGRVGPARPRTLPVRRRTPAPAPLLRRCSVTAFPRKHATSPHPRPR